MQLSLLPHVRRTLHLPLFSIQTKFAPTVPSQRRRRPDEAGPSSGAATTAAEAAAANEAFQDLIRAAQTESKWMRGRGRGFGRGRGGAATQVSHTTPHYVAHPTLSCRTPLSMAPASKSLSMGQVKVERFRARGQRVLVKPDWQRASNSCSSSACHHWCGDGPAAPGFQH